MAYLQFYKGYYTGGTPTVLSANPFDVAQDLSTGNLWQYTGNAWVAPSWNSAITFYLASATTVCERLSSEDTKYPETIHLYTGNDPLVPADLALSADDLAIKHDLGNYSIQVSVFRQDVTTDTVVEVPFPEGYVVSTEDGNWTILKNFNTYAGFDYCTVALTWTSVGGQIGPQVLDFVTSAEVEEMISSAISSGGFIDSGAVVEIVSDYAMPKAVEIVDSTSTSAYIPVLSGGQYYTFTQPVSALTVGSVVNSPAPAVINMFPVTVVDHIDVYFPLYGIWDEDYTGIIGSVDRAIHLVADGTGAYVFAPGDNYEWYSEDAASAWLAGGSFVCASSGAVWTISAIGVTEYIFMADAESASAYSLNGLIASSTDGMATWTITSDVIFRIERSDENMGLYDYESPATSITTNKYFPLNLPESVTYLNANSANLAYGKNNRLTFIQGAASVQEVVSSGGSYIAPYESSISALSGAAVIKNQPFSTTVWPYTMTYTSNGGLAVFYLDYDEEAGVATNQSAIFSAGDFTLVGSNDGNMRHYSISTGAGGITLEYGDDRPDSQTLVVGLDSITANGSAITQATSEFDGTSLSIFNLSGGVKYFCESALSELTIDAVDSGCNAVIFFTVDSEALVDLPDDLPFFGEYPTTPGTQYVLAINSDMMVCVASGTGA